MSTHVALLRGINVGGRNKVAMADLRAVVSSLGHTDVATYVASGNVVLTARSDDGAAVLGTELERAIADELGVTPSVVAVPGDELRRIVANNPFPDPDDLRHVHVAFRTDEPGDAEFDAVDDAQRTTIADGSRDRAQYVGRTLYLHTPDGMGRSRLAELLGRGPALRTATARNLRTVLRLQAMLDG